MLLILTAGIVVQLILALATVCAFAADRGKHPSKKPRTWPSVSMLRPVAGEDPEFGANLETLLALRYDGPWEVVLGFAGSNEPLLPGARKFLLEHPEIRARIVMTDPTAALNPKVAQLIGMTASSDAEVLVVSDANVRMRSDYLERVVSKLDNAGLVSSAVAASGEKTMGAAIDAAMLMHFILPAVVTAQWLGARIATIGKSMAMRAADLAALGGWESVGHVLAEDDVMGQRFVAHGHKICVDLGSIESRNSTATVARSFDRYSRWGKMRFRISPWTYLGEVLVNPFGIASAVFVVAPSATHAGWLLASLGAHAATALAASWATGSWSRWRLLVEPVRAWMTLLTWAAGWIGRRVAWKGHVFDLTEGSRLLPVTAPKLAAAVTVSL